MPLTRRDVLISVASAAGGAAGYGLYSGSLKSPLSADFSGALGDQSNSTDEIPMTQSLSGGFDRIVWQSDGSADVYFVNNHEMNAFYIMHETEDDLVEGIAACGAPEKFDVGPIEVPLIEYLREVPGRFPSRTFKFVGSTTVLSGCSNGVLPIPIETHSDAYFSVPRQFNL